MTKLSVASKRKWLVKAEMDRMWRGKSDAFSGHYSAVIGGSEENYETCSPAESRFEKGTTEVQTTSVSATTQVMVTL